MELLYAQVPGARRCRGERIDDLDSKMLNIRRRGGEGDRTTEREKEPRREEKGGRLRETN